MIAKLLITGICVCAISVAHGQEPKRDIPTKEKNVPVNSGQNTDRTGGRTSVGSTSTKSPQTGENKSNERRSIYDGQKKGNDVGGNKGGPTGTSGTTSGSKSQGTKTSGSAY